MRDLISIFDNLRYFYYVLLLISHKQYGNVIAYLYGIRGVRGLRSLEIEMMFTS